MYWHWWKWALVVVALGIVDRLLLWAEDNDWIYYRKRKANWTSMATSLFQLQSIVQPEKQHIVDQQRKIHEEKEDEDDIPPPPLDELPKP
jgi:hypothetical protein